MALFSNPEKADFEVTAKALTVLITIFGLFILYVSYTCLRNLYFHPLSSFPGPKTWTMSRIPYIVSLLRGRLVDDMADIHKKYGEVVRMAPDELSFATKEAWHDIYVHRPGHKNLTKSEIWYKAPQGMPQNIITAIDHADHSRMRRAFSNAFSEKTLRDQEPVIEGYVDLAMRRFRAMATAPETNEKGVVLNMVDWLNFFTIDVIGDLGFGESFGCLQDSAYHPWVKTLHNFLKGMVFAAATRFYPSVETLFMAMLPRSILELQKKHTEFANERVQRRLNLESNRPDFITPILKDDSAHKSITIPEIQSNTAILMVAGSETTATILSGAITYLLRNRESLRKLVTEVRTSFKREADITISNAKELLYLDAVLNEALRLCNPVPGALPRVVGRGGDTICDVFVPEQTTISIRPWIVNRDHKNFARPFDFVPERWLPADHGRPVEFAHDQLQASQPFSIGWANCMGRHLAWAELRIFLSKLLWTFDLEPDGIPLDWTKLKTYVIIQKEPVMVRLKVREGA